MSRAAFHIGQLVQHKLFEYRGVVYDVDPVFQGTEAWYANVARSRPPRDRPWYRVLVDGKGTETYVAERNLEPDTGEGPVDHPKVPKFFTGFENGIYQYRRDAN